MAAQVKLDDMAEALPGGVAKCDLTVRNAGTVFDRFRFEVKGDVSAWATVTPSSLELGPTAEGVVQVVFTLPRSSWPAAGALPVDVKVLSRAEPARPSVAQGVLRIAGFTDAGATVMPSVSHGRHRAQHMLTVHNRGNTPMQARIFLTRADRGLAVTVSPPQLNIASGRCETARLTASRRVPRLWGSGPTRSFDLTVEADGAAPLNVDAAMRQEAAGWGLRCGAVFGLLMLMGVLWVLAQVVA